MGHQVAHETLHNLSTTTTSQRKNQLSTHPTRPPQTSSSPFPRPTKPSQTSTVARSRSRVIQQVSVWWFSRARTPRTHCSHVPLAHTARRTGQPHGSATRASRPATAVRRSRSSAAVLSRRSRRSHCCGADRAAQSSRRRLPGRGSETGSLRDATAAGGRLA